MHKVLFWTGFGIFVRLWQLGIETRPFFSKASLIGYPIFGGIGGAFGYWLEGVETKQMKTLAEQKRRLLEKRERRAAAEDPAKSSASA